MRPTHISRRQFLSRATQSAFYACANRWGRSALFATPSLAAASAPASDATPPPTDAERTLMAQAARGFMQEYDAPGLSVAVGRFGALVYQEAFGFADRDRGETLHPNHLFRIASVSKPITSVTIFSLIEQGRLRLDDKVFGAGAVLGNDFGAPPYSPNIDRITIEHLLTHTAGGWSNDFDDPMFMNPQMNHAQLIEWTLRNRPLDNPPGDAFAYSNFGYCVLGRVIEKLTNAAYSSHIRDTVLSRCGISDMQIGGNTLAERRPEEVVYYSQERDSPYDLNLTRMDSFGGWIARPSDLVNLFMRVSGFAPPPNILRPETIQEMTTPSEANPDYAKGWGVNRAHTWWHTGNLPGTSTIAVRTRSGFCWAAFANTKREGSIADLDRLVWDMVGHVEAWQA